MSCLSVAEAQEGGFLHGVARQALPYPLPLSPALTPSFLALPSFDPTPESILLWTRFTPPPELADSTAIDVHWEIAAAGAFKEPHAQSGTATTSTDRDWTVCVDVRGLQSYTSYTYRFSFRGFTSPAGQTRTAPSGPVPDGLKFALVSCSNYAFGFFNVYDLVSRIDGLDFVVHAGDYIYEYEKGEYPQKWQQARHGLRPKGRCTSLADFRARYACYRRDPALQELHRRLPMIAVNDDHEIADSSFSDGAEDFDGGAGEFHGLRKAAQRALAEWVPMRGTPLISDGAPSPDASHRTFSFGNLFTLILVENRISHRSEPLDIEDTAFFKEVAEKSVKEWRSEAIVVAKDELREQLADPERQMLGEGQLADVAAAVRGSVAAGQPWQIFVSQTVLSPLFAPKIVETLPLQPRLLRWLCRGALRMATSAKIAGIEAARLARLYLGMGTYGAEMNPDAWDGYQAERNDLLDALDSPGSNPIVLAGDSHNAWAHEVMRPDGSRVGVEFDGPAVTSIGAFEDIRSRFVAAARSVAAAWTVPPLYVFSPWIADALKAANPDTLQYVRISS